MEHIIGAGLGIRRSISNDAEAIGKIRAANWRDQYAYLQGKAATWLTAKLEDMVSAEGNNKRAYWINQATQPKAQNYWLSAILLESQVVIGFFEARKYDGGVQELCGLHLASNQRGLRVGQALMNTARSEWLEPGATTFLHVAEENKAGQRFYQRSPNNYQLYGQAFMYGPIAMRCMVRLPEPGT